MGVRRHDGGRETRTESKLVADIAVTELQAVRLWRKLKIDQLPSVTKFGMPSSSRALARPGPFVELTNIDRMVKMSTVPFIVGAFLKKL